MNKYTVQYFGKSICVRAHSAAGAIRSYGQRMVFGRRTIFINVRILSVDTETRGRKWAVALADGIKVSAELALPTAQG